jgi:chloride channel 3/4/5
MLRATAKLARAGGDWSTIDWLQAGEAAQLDAGRSKHKSRFGGNDLDDIFTASEGWLAAVISGALMGFMAVLVEIGTLFVGNFRIGVCSGYFWLNRELCCPEGEETCGFIEWGAWFGGPDGRHRFVTGYIAYVFIGSFFAGTAAVFCRSFGMFAAGGGIIEVKVVASGHQFKNYLTLGIVLLKSFCVCLASGCGLPVGKEGPFVHIGASIANVVGGLFPTFRSNAARRREFIAAGAGGGVAAAFGAPIGGVLFALEEIVSFFSFRSMMQTLIYGVAAVLVMKQFDTMHTGRIVQFSIDYRHRWHWFELPLFALLGAFCGLMGSANSVWNVRIIKFRKTTQLKQWPITEVICLAAIANMINFVVPFSKGSMLGTLAELFQDCSGESELCTGHDFYIMSGLIVAGLTKLVLNACTVGTAVPSGILVPALMIGGAFGRVFGILVSTLQQQYPHSTVFQECNGLNLCVIPGAYAIVGAAALLTGSTRMTVCLAVIMFELTGGLEYLVPVIIGILAAKWAGEAIGVDCIYELGIEANLLPYLDPKKEFPHPYVTSDICGEKKYKTVYAHDMTLQQLHDLLNGNDYHGFPLVASPTDDNLLGYVRRDRLIDALHATARGSQRNVTLTTRVRFTDQRLATEADDTAEENDDGAAAATPTDPYCGPELDFSDYVDNSVVQVSPDCTVARLLYMFKSLGSRHILVTRFSRFSGLVTKKDLIQFMRRIEHEEEEEAEELLHIARSRTSDTNKQH